MRGIVAQDPPGETDEDRKKFRHEAVDEAKKAKGDKVLSQDQRVQAALFDSATIDAEIQASNRNLINWLDEVYPRNIPYLPG